MEALENAEIDNEPDQELEDDFVMLVKIVVMLLMSLYHIYCHKANAGEPGLPVYITEHYE